MLTRSNDRASRKVFSSIVHKSTTPQKDSLKCNCFYFSCVQMNAAILLGIILSANCNDNKRDVTSWCFAMDLVLYLASYRLSHGYSWFLFAPFRLVPRCCFLLRLSHFFPKSSCLPLGFSFTSLPKLRNVWNSVSHNLKVRIIRGCVIFR